MKPKRHTGPFRIGQVAELLQNLPRLLADAGLNNARGKR